jgi:hypothetical protein
MATLHTTLTRNTINTLTVGNAVTDGCVIIRYSCTRGVALAGAGIIVVLNKAVPEDPYHAYFFDDVGIPTDEITAEVVGTNLRVKIPVDNSVAFNIVFNYTITIIKS